jgi:threonine aldolase
MKRRSFITKNILAAAAAPMLMSSGMSGIDDQGSDKVQFTRDGLDLDPQEYSDLLSRLSRRSGIVDNYSRFGVVEEMEKKFAAILGMESAVFMPTGTLANHIAIRKLAGNKKRVLVQSLSHVYNDTGDAAQQLSGLNVIPIGGGSATFNLEEVKKAVDITENGRVKSGVGVISIESPVRRLNNEVFDYSEMQRISNFARQNGIGMHLDGARLFNAVVHTGISARDFASLFDTVYISLYKDFNAASGAVLCGSKEFTKDLYHERRMFGGGMPQAWPFALVANHFADSFIADYRKALESFNKFKDILNLSGRFKLSSIENGTNVFRMEVDTVNIQKFRSVLEKNNIFLPAPSGNTFYPKTNTTLLRVDPDRLAEIFLACL